MQVPGVDGLALSPAICKQTDQTRLLCSPAAGVEKTAGVDAHDQVTVRSWIDALKGLHYSPWAASTRCRNELLPLDEELRVIRPGDPHFFGHVLLPDSLNQDHSRLLKSDAWSVQKKS